jgi:hypothetical protein
MVVEQGGHSIDHSGSIDTVKEGQNTADYQHHLALGKSDEDQPVQVYSRLPLELFHDIQEPVIHIRLIGKLYLKTRPANERTIIQSVPMFLPYSHRQ